MLAEDQELYTRFVDPQVVQILADNNEVQRRISSFIQRKRHESNLSNQLEFCAGHSGDQSEVCARTNVANLQTWLSGRHVKRIRVENDDSNLAATMSLRPSVASKSAAEERLRNLERQLNIKPVGDLNSRLRVLEDQLLSMETTLPELFHLPMVSYTESTEL
eukprot:Colp12_sorted_trinity150504_noHs@14411